MVNNRPEQPLTVVVTGGARGIGSAFAAGLLEEGYNVVVADVAEPSEQLHAASAKAAGRLLVVPTDVTSEDSLTHLHDSVVNCFGMAWGLVNNAGIYQDLGAKRDFTEITATEWQRVLDVNLTGTWLATKAFAPDLRAKGGRVVNTGSSTVHMGVPNFAHYLASKGGVHALTRGLSRELGVDGVTVNALAPGLISNEASRNLNGDEYFPRAAAGRAVPRQMHSSDLVGTLLFLMNPATSFLTGQTIVVDGGAVFA